MNVLMNKQFFLECHCAIVFALLEVKQPMHCLLKVVSANSAYL